MAEPALAFPREIWAAHPHRVAPGMVVSLAPDLGAAAEGLAPSAAMRR